MNAFNVVRNTGVNLQLPAEPADVVADVFLHTTVKRHIPDFFRNNRIGNHAVGICYQHGEDVKLLCRQIDFFVADTYRPAFQTEIQVSCAALCQLLRWGCFGGRRRWGVVQNNTGITVPLIFQVLNQFLPLLNV